MQKNNYAPTRRLANEANVLCKEALPSSDCRHCMDDCRVQRCKAWGHILFKDWTKLVFISDVAICISSFWLHVLSDEQKAHQFLGYEAYRPFWHFFDFKAYVIMTCMMSGGIGFRAAGIFPEKFIAFFYSGLGLALALAGVMFTINHLFYNHLIQKEQDSQWKIARISRRFQT